jgi:hypothetical protein
MGQQLPLQDIHVALDRMAAGHAMRDVLLP